MPTLKNHEVWIESDGERYAEYDVKVKGDVVTCYVASQADKTFQIGWMNHNKPILISTSAKFYVDSVKLDSIVHQFSSPVRSSSSMGHWVNSSSLMPYKFSHIALTDDDTLPAPSKHIGTISVKVHRVVVVQKLEDFVTRTLPDDFQKPLSERAKKISSHRVSFGDVKDVAAKRGSLKTVRYQNEVGPDLIPHFHGEYQDFLQALQIIPVAVTAKRPETTSQVSGHSGPRAEGSKRRRRSLANVKTEDHVIDLSDDDEREKEQEPLKQQAEISRKLKKLKKRRKSSNAELKSETKAEDNSNMMELTYDDNGAIDLTLD